ncbi:MAG TPA: peptidoglycan-binding protein [Candidatus Paceibacterota bacterium]|nr:peptidoglycan-binding protein [Candidatus Paceibacterota bacterium]
MILRHAHFLSVGLAVILIVSFLFAIPFATAQAASKKDDEKALSIADVKAAYAEAKATGTKMRILIMPGHEPTYGGAQFAGYYEREFVVDIAEKLAAELRSDPNLEVLVARGDAGWNSDFDRYFSKNEKNIKKFVDEHKETFAKKEKKERRNRDDDDELHVSHNTAPNEVALRLYGINRWANDNDVTMVLHLHLNDETGHGENVPGTYSGLAVYVPDDSFKNADASRELAESVYERLTDITAKSTMPIEDQGIVEDKELIAVGAYDTALIPSILLEYGYIYEPKFMGEGARQAVFTDYAYQTALGVKDILGTAGNPAYDTKALPYAFGSDILTAALAASTTPATSTPNGQVLTDRGIYALQMALKEAGFYPPVGTSLINCPIDGYARTCLVDAVKAFQASKGLEQTGGLGPLTRAALNAAYSGGMTAAPAPVTVPIPGTPTTPITAPAAGGTMPAGSPAAAACTPFTKSVELDSEDATSDGEVTRLQTVLALDAAIYPEGLVTGYFGPATDKAVKALQAKNGLAKAGDSGYGVVGPKTSAALMALCAAS